MLTGADLGKAIESALALKGVSKADLARHFGVKPPSISGWIKTGRISKPHFEKLRQYLADVVGPEQWGLSNDRPYGASEPAPLAYNSLSDDERCLVFAYRKASKDARAGMLAFARAVLPDCQAVASKRTRT